MPMSLQRIHEAEPVHPFEVSLHHFALSVPDLEASIAWYREILGFSIEMRHAFPERGCRGVFLRRGAARIELFEVEGATPLPDCRRDVDEDLRTHGAKHLALSVPDVRRAFEYFKSRNVEIALPVTEIDGTVTGYIRDNSGILVEISEPFLNSSS